MKIGIAIPTYDRPELLQKLLASIPCHIMVNVSDNGMLVSPKINNLTSNITIVGDSTVINMFDNWNRAFHGLNVEVMAIPSDDDLYLEDGFEIIEEETRKNPDCDVFVFGNHYIDENDKVFSTWIPRGYEKFEAPEGFNIFRYGVDARMPCIFFRKALLDRIGYLDSRFELTAADSELVQRALLYGRALFVPKVVGSYRVWGGALTAKKIASDHWLEEIGVWTDKISTLAVEEFGKVGKHFDRQRFVDEIYARNLIAGASNKIRSGENGAARKYLFEHRFPKRATLVTKLNYLRVYLKSYYHR